MYSSNMSYEIVRHQINERLEEARRERLANAVNRPSLIRSLATGLASRLLRRRPAISATETITADLPSSQAPAGSS